MIIAFIFRISALEKERNTPLYSRRSEFRKDYCELEELDLKGTNDRKTESEFLLCYQFFCFDSLHCRCILARAEVHYSSIANCLATTLDHWQRKTGESRKFY